MSVASSEDIDARATRIASALRREFGDQIDFIDAAAHIEIGVRAVKAMGMPLHAIVDRLIVVFDNAPGPASAEYVDVPPDDGEQCR